MRRKISSIIKNALSVTMTGILAVSLVLAATVPALGTEPVPAYAAADRAQIEAALYNAEYYEKANEDVAVALGKDPEKMYLHWLNVGKAEGRNASMVFNAKYYLEVNKDVAAVVGNDYVAAYEHFVNNGLAEGRESSPVFSVKYYLEANTDVAAAFNGDYVLAANHFNANAINEGRSGSGNFDYTVYRACNKDVEELYKDYVEGYYIHYINHGRAEGRTAGLAAGGDTGSGSDTPAIDTSAASYRIFDTAYYLERYPELKTAVGTDKDTLYLYWMNEGIDKGQTASPVIVPEEYLKYNADVAGVFKGDPAGAIRHFLNYGILEGRTGSTEFDYTIYASCNTDVGDVFAEDIVGYYFHYVTYGKQENRTAAVYVPDEPGNPDDPDNPDDPEVPDVTVSDTAGYTYVLGFDETERMISQAYYSGETLLGSNELSYNEDGSLAGVVFKDAAGTEIGTRSFAYAEGVLAGLKETVTTGTVRFVTEYSAEEGTATAELLNGRTGKEVKYNPDGSVSERTEFLYYPDGSLKEEAKYDGTGASVYIRQYKENGDPVIDLGDVEF